MEKFKIEQFLISNKKYFPSDRLIQMKEIMQNMPDEKFFMLSAAEYKDPTVMLLVSVFLGSLGIDRFLLGDTAMGVLKLLTAGLCGILTIIDWFTVSNAVKEKNYNEFMYLANL